MVLANSLSKSFIKDKPFFSNDPRNLPRNLPNSTILGSWVFDSFILADELFVFAKILRSLETCPPVKISCLFVKISS